MLLRRLLLVPLLALNGCDQPSRHASAPLDWTLTTAPLSGEWVDAEMEGTGAVGLHDAVIALATGRPMTGIRFDGWDGAGLPLLDYAASYETRRVAGRDFFGTLTFPVGSLDRCVSLVIGGWGGAVVGISSIDDADAGGNETRSEQVFQDGQWYRVRIEVRSDDIRAFIDDRIVVNVNIKGRRLSLRAGEIQKCAPFGFASYATEGEVRKVRVERLRD